MKKKPISTVTGDCSTCGFKKGMMNPAKGNKLPGGGKCTRCEGLCEAVKKEKGPSPKKAPKTTAPARQGPQGEFYARD